MDGRIFPRLVLIEKDPSASAFNKHSPEYPTLLRSCPSLITHWAGFAVAPTGIERMQVAATIETKETTFNDGVVHRVQTKN